MTRFDAGGQLIGALAWAPSSGGTCEFHLDVEPGSQRQGVGRSMVEELEALGKEKGWMGLYSFCASDNESALQFFKALGFRSLLASHFYGEGRHAWFLWKPIGGPQ